MRNPLPKGLRKVATSHAREGFRDRDREEAVPGADRPGSCRASHRYRERHKLRNKVARRSEETDRPAPVARTAAHVPRTCRRKTPVEVRPASRSATGAIAVRQINLLTLAEKGVGGNSERFLETLSQTILANTRQQNGGDKGRRALCRHSGFRRIFDALYR